MEEELTPSDGGEVCPASSIYRVGDTVVFEYEGNVRATVEGSEVVEGRVWFRCHAELVFEVPASQWLGSSGRVSRDALPPRLHVQVSALRARSGGGVSEVVDC